MLVLTRKVGERIQVGDHITLTLVKINGSVVRIGIEAPADMAVMREELAGTKKSESVSVSVTPNQPSRV